jgi:hypothetical protein
LRIEKKTNITLLQIIEAKILIEKVTPTYIHEALLEKTIKIWNSKGNGYVPS